ncbi:MAG: single-stranded-DNA-specific exonuclease RecJ [Chloroherpetonaceae bacterium]|nr:single-stranded-DNA-specific exonuclease RecJ [Chloroherpetonaceae bacterium]MCS7212582.1 single-stranded-DNA-specific exonuclease RecJ [Chloroherpetonaceae bacterium]MDW8020801.1 single-stranded-DNA-specific exonuclease RecJ [Chloroherpetonaceae bacterium]MDW8464673.1 single-stranded-DNA-specific exonuclease RecJ [Chloroherpetonaceae bacterium]
MRKHYRWRLLQPDSEKVFALARAINASLPIAKALCNRGIFTFDDAKRFFRPEEAPLHSPFLMRDMQHAAERLSQAIERGERIMIYGDYDVDGTTGTALLLLFLRELGAEVLFYINDRFKEGYGVARSGIEYAHEKGVSLIISVDCGITAFEPIKYAQSLGIDFIVCDHHESSLERPPALAVLDPKRPDCDYPFKELSGCGVAFKLAEAVCTVRGLPAERAYAYLDLVAAAIAADIVPALGENRTLLARGIAQTKKNPRLAFSEIFNCARYDSSHLSTSDLVFIVAPRINAAGRMDHARQVVELLTTANGDLAAHLALTLEKLNTERRHIDRQMTEEALRDAERLLSIYPSSVVLYKPDWHLGVVGIVASRIAEHFYVPTIVLTEANGVLKGSARSIADFDLYDAISACKEHLLQFGGHAAAAGLSLPITSLEAFRAAFERACAERLKMEQRNPEIVIDAELRLEEITPNFLAVLKRFEPCGPGNRHPVFLTRGVRQTCSVQVMKNEHLRLHLSNSHSHGSIYPAVGFHFAHYLDMLQDRSRPLDIVYSIEENCYNGQTSVQFRLRDVQLSSA